MICFLHVPTVQERFGGEKSGFYALFRRNYNNLQVRYQTISNMQLQQQDEAGSVSEKTDICLLMEEITISFAALLEEKNITLSLSCPINTHLLLTSPFVLLEVL